MSRLSVLSANHFVELRVAVPNLDLELNLAERNPRQLK